MQSHVGRQEEMIVGVCRCHACHAICMVASVCKRQVLKYKVVKQKVIKMQKVKKKQKVCKENKC